MVSESALKKFFSLLLFILHDLFEMIFRYVLVSVSFNTYNRSPRGESFKSMLNLYPFPVSGIFDFNKRIQYTCMVFLILQLLSTGRLFHENAKKEAKFVSYTLFYYTACSVHREPLKTKSYRSVNFHN